MSHRTHRKGTAGFTLIEVLIVVAIIGVVTSLAIPHLMETRKSATEAAAIEALRAIVSAQALYADQDKDGDGRANYGCAKYARIVSITGSRLLR